MRSMWRCIAAFSSR